MGKCTSDGLLQKTQDCYPTNALKPSCTTSITFDFLLPTGIRAAVPIGAEARQHLGTTGAGLLQCGAYVLSQTVVFHQLCVDPPPCHFVLHQTSLHYCTQLLLLGHLALQVLCLLTALQGEGHTDVGNGSAELKVGFRNFGG